MIFYSEAVDFGILSLLFFAIFAYAEIHYKFKFIPSRYRIVAPEIIADVPLRLSPGRDLPILILVKDADRYPAKIHQVSVQISSSSGPQRVVDFYIERDIVEPWWQRLLRVPRHHEEAGWCEIRVNFKISIFGRAQHFTADNYLLTGHSPFRCYFAEELLPALPNFYTGDLHTHSSYTSDQVEFGAPPNAIAQMAQAMGHHFTAITDHSYDLDDECEDYLQNDPALKKWKSFLSEVRFCNSHFENFVMIPGEEVSCGNARGQNVHMLILNNPEFVPGAGDSGEKWLHTTPDLSIADITAKPMAHTLYFAAHPETPVPLLQRLLLRRNTWQPGDYLHWHLHGLQIWNGHVKGMEEARRSWIRLLLHGECKTIIAGSDAHGNFNRFRQIKMPHLSMEEHDRYHLFGQHRTIAYIEQELSLQALMSALQHGATAITSGPFLAITAIGANLQNTPMGGDIFGEPATLELLAYSSQEFGPVSRVVLFKGTIGAAEESVMVDEALPYQSFSFSAQIALPAPPESGCYYRAEVHCAGAASLPAAAMTNPIWHRLSSDIDGADGSSAQ